MGKMIDLTGQVFDKLTVIDCAGKLVGRRYFWNCKCECGNVKAILGTSLRNGNTKSCGCGKYDGLKKYNLDQSESGKIPINTRFGKLEVIEDIGFRKQVEGHNRRWYRCKCDCGNEKEVMGNMLKSGQVSSCGHCLPSLGEYQISQILDENHIFYQHDIVLPELYAETSRRLRFDFIIYDDDLITPIRMIEFDGRQHTLGPEAIWSNSDSIEVIKERDNIKNTFCITHNYPLVRIPYTKLNNITIDDLLGDQYLVKGDDFSDTH